MPFFTQHYGLGAFTTGDTDSASVDRRRFSIIDNQMSFIAEQIGDGIIDGWEITESDDEIGRITISPGTALIDGFFVKTYGNIEFDVPLNRKLYLYMRRLGDTFSEVSSFSDVASTSYVDTTPPSQPGTPTVDEVSFDHIEIKWTSGNEADLDSYLVYKSTNGVDFTFAGESSSASYLDESVDQDTDYYYKVKAVDVNGNQSSFSGTLHTSTIQDPRTPPDPSGFQILTGNQTMQVYWDAGLNLVDHYEIVITPCDYDGTLTGAPTTVTVGNTVFNYIFTNLENGQHYQITVKSVSVSGIKSPGLSGIETPFYTGGSSEVTNIQVSSFPLDSVSWKLAIRVLWDLQTNEYVPTPDYYFITVSSGTEDGVPSIYITEDVTLYRYSVRFGNNEVTRNLQENTTYTIRIQTVSGDIVSRGFIYKFKTPKYRPPQPISELEITTEYTVNRRFLRASWQNSVSDFAYNELTVKRTSLDDEYGDISYIFDADNYGQASSVTLQPVEVLNGCQYEVSVTPVDNYGNRGETSSAIVVINETFEDVTIGNNVIDDGAERPPVPDQQFGIAGDDEVTIYWNDANSDIINKYRIYRAEFSDGFSPSDFQLVAEVPSTELKFKDYRVDNDINYAYFVTSIDVFDKESLNPSDNYISYPLILVKPHRIFTLTKPNVISLTKDGYDVVLSWTPSDDSFDGHEIYRSVDNLYSFEYIGSTSPGDGSFIDEDALTYNGNYYYMLRKYRNEAALYTSRTKLPPSGSLPIGVVTHSVSGLTINSNARFVIKSLIGPIQREMAAQLGITPTHQYFSKGDDRRVRLQNNLVVPNTLWTTDDYQTYTTEVGLASTNDYIAYIDGTQSAFNSKVDVENGTLTFDEAIYDPSLDEREPKIDPVVSVIFRDVYETTGILPSENIEDIFANRITKGIVSLDRLPEISHFGRYREKLTPKSFPAVRLSSYLFNYTIPSGVTFYDVLITPDNLIMAATSEGIRITDTDKTGWSVKFRSPKPTSKLIYSQTLELYFCACGDEVRYSNDRETWLPIAGMSGAKVVRDLVENDGIIFASTDSGVYYCRPTDFIKVLWTQLPAFDDLNTNAYGLAFSDDTLYVSGERGIYTSSDIGETWDNISGSELQVPCFSISVFDDYIFAVSNNAVWRKKTTSDFEKIGDFSFACRKCVLFANQLYITTDAGLYCNSSDFDVFTDDHITWNLAFKNTVRNTKMPVTFSLNIFNGKMWMGMDERLYSASEQRKLQLHSEEQVISPTFFVNQVERSVGIFYSLSGNIQFDHPLAEKDVVNVVNTYTQFTSTGGWADTKFDADVIVTINGTDLVGPDVVKIINGYNWKFPPAPFKCSSDPQFVVNSLNQITTPFFNERVANFDKAQAELRNIVFLTDSVQTMVDDGETIVPFSVVANIFKSLDSFKSYIHPELRQYVKYPPLFGTFSINGYAVDFDVISGEITIKGAIGKYTLCQLSVKEVSISNVGEISHDDIELSFEKWNSGLSAPMALVQESNVIKGGIWYQQMYPDELRDQLLEYQSSHSSVCDSGWYNKLLSTIDYDQKLAFEPSVQGVGSGVSVGFSIEYPADVIYIESIGEVWVCGQGGILSIDVLDHTIKKIYASEFYFYSMNLSEGTVYAIAEDGLYTINISSGVVEKQVDTVLPRKSNGVYSNADTVFIAAEDGVYSKKSFEPDWSKVFSLNSPKLRVATNLAFAIGTDPADADNALVYYSYGGAIWNRTSLTDIQVYSIAQRGNFVYYGTNSGLIVEDLTRLFQQQTFSGPTIVRVPLTDDDLTLKINDVDATVDSAAVSTQDGKWYLLDGNAVNDSGDSTTGTIHKIRIIGSEIWLFSNNLVEIVGESRLIRLSTGKVLV